MPRSLHGAVQNPGAALLLAATLMWSPSALAERVDALALHGFSRVRQVLIEELLPRPLPAELSENELIEFERRLWTLGLFDDIEISVENKNLTIRVREKWTLIPGVELGTARTLRDSYALLSLTEYNTAGRAIEIGGYAAYGERALSAELWFSEHQAAARRPTFEGELSWIGSGLFFDDSLYAWERRRTGAMFGVRWPFAYGTRLRLASLAAVYHETLNGNAPPSLRSGTFGVLGGRMTWDAYSWHDLTPSGLRVTLELVPGMIARGADVSARHNAFAQAVFALPLSSSVVLMANAVGEAVSPGDPNHSALLGNISAYRFAVGQTGGVRGLDDNLHRNVAHSYGNLELRGSWALWPRWFLQTASFVDGGVFWGLDAHGRVRAPKAALSSGVGLRLVPTSFAWLVPRVDVGRRVLPSGSWFWTIGLSQYF